MWFAERADLQVGLLEDRLVVHRLRTRDQPAEVVVFESLATGAVWQPAVTALGEWLRQQGLGRVGFQVRLSGHFVRWKLLEWAAPLQQPQELQAYAEMQMRATFGADVQSWQVVHAEPSPGQPLMACAVDQALVQALRSLESDTQAKLTGLAPYFSVAYDHWRRRIGRAACWFGVIEPTAFTLGLLQHGAWRGLRTLRLAPHGEAAWREALPALQAQIGLASGCTDTAALPIYLSGCTREPSHSPTSGGVWLSRSHGKGDVSGIERLARGI